LWRRESEWSDIDVATVQLSTLAQLEIDAGRVQFWQKLTASVLEVNMLSMQQGSCVSTGVHRMDVRYKKAAKRKLLILALVCVGWLLLGWVSMRDNLFGGILWQTSKAAALDAAANPSAQSAQNTPVYQPAQPAVALTGFTYTSQTLNNCGSAVLAMNLSYYGVTLDQQTIAQTLRPNPNDENVRADELASYAIAQGYRATLRVNGNADQLRLFLSNRIPVIIETWESDDPAKLTDGFAHFRLITGYDDARQVWIAYDSYISRGLINPQGPYQGMYVSYAQADQLWRIMNRKYVVIYTAEQAPIVQNILGGNLADQPMWQGAITQARAEMHKQPNDPFAWFNLGSSLYASGLSGQAVQAFQKAQALGLPTRMLWYQYEPLEAYYAGRQYKEVVNLVDANLTTATGIEELYYWKALALAALDEPNQAHQALQHALAIKPNYQQALTVLNRGLGG
jgi:tetratricopeptide (TPR) repeat protein